MNQSMQRTEYAEARFSAIPLTPEAILERIADAAEFQRQRQNEPHAFEAYLHAALRAYAPHSIHAHWAWLAMDSMREAGLMPQQEGHA